MSLHKALATALLLSAAAPRDSLVAAQNNPRPAPTQASAEAAGIDRGEYTTCPQVSSLHCKNGSTCEEGIANFDSRHDHLGLQTHESGWYCKCIDGFIGHECQIQVDDCDGDTGYNPSDPTGVLTSCYHGSTCKHSGSGFYCDCNQLNDSSGPTAKKFAGLMCQHESTSMCAASLVGLGHSPAGQFCTNHGKCVKMVVGDEPHPGCVCRDGWSGDHCEIREDPNRNIPRLKEGEEGGGNVIAGKVLFSLLIIAMGCVVTGIAVLLVKAKRQHAAAGSEVRVEKPAKEKTVVGAGDLEPDGSGTLGTTSSSSNNGTLGSSSSNNVEAEEDGNGEDADGGGDLELTENAEKVQDESEDGPTETEIV